MSWKSWGEGRPLILTVCAGTPPVLRPSVPGPRLGGCHLFSQTVALGSPAQADVKVEAQALPSNGPVVPGVWLGAPGLRFSLIPSHQERVFLSISHKHLLCHFTAFSFHSPAALLSALPHP